MLNLVTQFHTFVINHFIHHFIHLYIHHFSSCSYINYNVSIHIHAHTQHIKLCDSVTFVFQGEFTHSREYNRTRALRTRLEGQNRFACVRASVRTWESETYDELHQKWPFLVYDYHISGLTAPILFELVAIESLYSHYIIKV